MSIHLDRGFALMIPLLLGAGALGCATEPSCDLAPELDAASCDIVRGFAMPAELGPAAGNAKGDDPDAALLGFSIFYDARFSADQSIRCASCHAPEKHFHDGLPLGVGLASLTRNSPTVLGAAQAKWQFWDGRADSLWSQAIFPFETPKEMDFTRLEIAHRVAKSYGAKYEAIFGPLPPLDDAVRFPARGAPGDPAWEAMSTADQDAINLLAANVGKSLEAYERKLAARKAPLDRFLAGDKSALGEAEARGLVLFMRAGCADCHKGSMLSDDDFHNLGLPPLEGEPPDLGRYDGLAVLSQNPFNSQGPYWDGARPEPPPPATEADRGAFRTPSLRNVTLTAPYGHNGQFATLQEIIAFHLQGGGLGDPGVVGQIDPALVPQVFSAAEIDDIVAFLGALTDDGPPRPWNDWPDR